MKKILTVILFSLLTIQCFSQDRPTGLVKPVNWEAQVEKDMSKPTMSIMSQLPSKWNWIEEGMVTPIRDQGWCGSCWAFGTVASMESAILIKDGIKVDLSEQWLIDTSRTGSCKGGWISFNRFYNEYDKCYFLDISKDKKTIDWTGAVLEQEYPYTGEQGGCPGYNPKRYFKTQGQVFFGYKGEDKPICYNEIKYGLLNYGPLVAEVVAKGRFNTYHGGILSGGKEYTEKDINHMICIVGYDDTSTTPHLIIKNSWGTGWGEQGFGKIAYGSFMVGFDAVAPVYAGGGPLLMLPDPTPIPTPTPTPVPTPVLSITTILSDNLEFKPIIKNWNSKWFPNEGNWVVSKTDGYNESSFLTKISDNSGTFTFRWKGYSPELLGFKYYFSINGEEETTYNLKSNAWLTETVYLPARAIVSWETTKTIQVNIGVKNEAYIDDFSFAPQESLKIISEKKVTKDKFPQKILILVIFIVGLLFLISIYYNK